MEQWAIKLRDKDVYLAAVQYGPKGSITISSKDGGRHYQPMIFRSMEEASKCLDNIRPRLQKTIGRGEGWEVVKFDP